ncbi:DUF2993 domain-containing protein [Microcoleus sp. FACHB-1515]|uniref:LmeA family phospholipid-binding protein n=1 Tax=Cyanophyceae TaxID=3028117 RepID=UPI001689EAB5|nr:DUF2993 domain-containing protein [Microcoleus sp. FACHB-1515]MBD2088968.1 DUF2993 domain-containing protein [Microcoleus sp. FACHB-1515]
MDFLTILLSVLIGLVAPVGFVSDRLLENQIRQQFDSVEDLQVRVDNRPTYQLLQGRVDRIRIAGSGLSIEPLRIATLEVETDPIAVDLGDELELKEPLQAGVRIVLTEADIEQALRSPRIRNLLNDLNLGELGGAEYQIRNPRLQLLAGDRIRLRAILQQEDSSEQLAIDLRSGIRVVAGRQLQFDSPTATLNGESIPDRLVEGFASGISQRFDLQNFEEAGLTARILQLNISEERIELAAFVRIEPESDLLGQTAIEPLTAAR